MRVYYSIGPDVSLTEWTTHSSTIAPQRASRVALLTGTKVENGGHSYAPPVEDGFITFTILNEAGQSIVGPDFQPGDWREDCPAKVDNRSPCFERNYMLDVN